MKLLKEYALYSQRIIFRCLLLNSISETRLICEFYARSYLSCSRFCCSYRLKHTPPPPTAAVGQFDKENQRRHDRRRPHFHSTGRVVEIQTGAFHDGRGERKKSDWQSPAPCKVRGSTGVKIIRARGLSTPAPVL